MCRCCGSRLCLPFLLVTTMTSLAKYRPRVQCTCMDRKLFSAGKKWHLATCTNIRRHTWPKFAMPVHRHFFHTYYPLSHPAWLASRAPSFEASCHGPHPNENKVVSEGQSTTCASHDGTWLPPSGMPAWPHRGMNQDMGLGDPLQALQREEIGPHAFCTESSSGSARPRVLPVEHSSAPYDTGVCEVACNHSNE